MAVASGVVDLAMYAQNPVQATTLLGKNLILAAAVLSSALASTTAALSPSPAAASSLGPTALVARSPAAAPAMRPLLVAAPSLDTAAAVAPSPAKIVITRSGGARLVGPYKPPSIPVLASSIGGREQRDDVRIGILDILSIKYAFMKFTRFKEVENDCTESLNLDDHYVKAYSHKITARKELGKLKEAMDDAKFAVTIDPNNSELRKQYSDIKALHMEVNNLYFRIFIRLLTEIAFVLLTKSSVDSDPSKVELIHLLGLPCRICDKANLDTAPFSFRPVFVQL
ncbi:hypothetical protein ABZP36_016107 [Zizania latifolia]